MALTMVVMSIGITTISLFYAFDFISIEALIAPSMHFHEDEEFYSSLFFSYKKSSGFFGDLILLAVVGVVIYALYCTCIAPSTTGTAPDSGYPRSAPRDPRGSPPPYGFRDDYGQGTCF